MNLWRKVGTGLAIAVAILVALGFWARTQMRYSSYPISPPMPAVVSEPMPEILAHLESILRTNAPQALADLQRGLSATNISQLEEQYHIQLPEEIKAIYQWHNGTHSHTNYVGDNFMPGHRFLPLEEALEENAIVSKGAATLLQRAVYRVLCGHRDPWICLFSDGAGDGYWFDPKRKPAEGAVFYNFNEEGAYVFFPSAKNLMAGIVKCHEQGVFRHKTGSSPPELDEDFERSAKVWNEFGASNQP